MTFGSPRDDATVASVDATATPWWVVGAGALLLALGFGRKPMTVAPRSRERRRTGTGRDTRTRTRAELDAEMEHQTTRDTTEGGSRPMGARGAKMADTVGQAKV